MNKDHHQEERELQEAIKTAGNLPAHVAIIMDGNGRWAKKRGLPRVEGHKEGINSVREVVETAGELGIKFLTLYTFSTENWRRPKGEVTALMSLLLRTIREEVDELNKKNVRLTTIGHLDDLPYLPREGITHALRVLQNNTGLTLNLALSYSGRQEMTDCIRTIAAKAQQGLIKPEDVTEQLISQELYTADLPDPDLLIRTSGELRLSNFLLWQLAYTEIYVTEVLWPDFRRREFLTAISCYQKRERRYGKVSEQIQAEKAHSR